MSDYEREICTRLREFLESTKWPQEDAAREMGISRDRLASIVYARIPLRYDVAKRLGEKFDVGLQWLALGQPPIRPYLPPDPAEDRRIGPRSLLSLAYATVKPGLDHRLCIIDARGSMKGLERIPGIPPGEAYEWALRGVVKRTLDKLPVHLRFEFLQTVMATASKFTARHRGEIAGYLRQSKARPAAPKRTSPKATRKRRAR